MFYRYGPDARRCLSILTLPSEEQQNEIAKVDSDLKDYIKKHLWEVKDWGDVTSASTVTHQLFMAQPIYEHAKAIGVPSSAYIARLLWEGVDKEEINKARDLVKTLRQVPQLRSAAGTVFELAALAKIGAGGNLLVTAIGAASATTSKERKLSVAPPGDICRRTLSFECADVLRTHFTAYPGKLLIPVANNFPSVDAMLITPEPASEIWLFQVTLASSHKISATGLERIRKVVPKSARPTKVKKWCFVIVTDEKTNVTSTPVTGTEEQTEKWEKLLNKYILRFDLHQLFDAARDVRGYFVTD